MHNKLLYLSPIISPTFIALIYGRQVYNASNNISGLTSRTDRKPNRRKIYIPACVSGDFTFTIVEEWLQLARRMNQIKRRVVSLFR